MTCSTSTITALQDSVYLHFNDSTESHPLSIPVTASGDPVVVVGCAVFANAGTDVGDSLAISAPWAGTARSSTDYDHYMQSMFWIADSTPPNIVHDWSGAAASHVLVATSIPTNSTSPVQTKFAAGDAALVATSAPTSGNLMLLFELVDNGTGGATRTGWTKLNTAADGQLTIYARCAGAGESTTIDAAFLSNAWHGYQEWGASVTNPPVADFEVDDNAGPVPLTVNFTDLSTNSPTSWAWTFGDGGTSTSQNPSHVYSTTGGFSVTLTATNADGSDSETKSLYITVTEANTGVPPDAARALIEIYVDEAGAYRWDEATWDDAVWATSQWTDITPESIDATVIWGSSNPELGILSQPQAESWSLNIYDPDRILDPANVDGPYYGSLKPGLPIRINHGTAPHFGYTVRTGIVESIGHEFLEPHLSDFGYIRATNDQATYSNASVPHDTTLSDTLFERARDALAAAGLPDRVLPTPDVDPALIAWSDPGSDQSAWSWIADAAQQVLWVPYFDRHGWLGFRAYSAPITRSVQLAAPELVGLLSISQYNGLYSRVIVHDDMDVEIIRHVDAGYGTRTFTRSDPTPDAEAWATAVLADRAFGSLWWRPGDVTPFTAARVKIMAAMTAVEAVHISHDYTSPIVETDAIVVGGSIVLTARNARSADWRFNFQTTQNVPEPLAVDGADPIEYIVRDGGPDTEYLFPG